MTEKKRGCVCLMPEKSTVQVFFKTDILSMVMGGQEQRKGSA